MKKGLLSIALAAAMVAGVFSALPVAAQEAEPPAATQVPDVVQIDDPQGDASTLGGDEATPAGNVSDVGDLRKIWFSNTAETLSVHVQTSATPPAGSVATLYTVLATPGEGPVTNQTAGCLQFRVFVPAANAGGTYQGDLKAKLHDRCNEGTNWLDNGVEGEAVIEALDDETGLITLTFPRSYSPLLADGQSIGAPTARSDALAGTDQAEIPATPATNHSHPWAGYRYDDTKAGTDYLITSGGDVVEEPPGDDVVKEEKKLTRKKCMKIKNKRKRKRCLKKLKAQNQPPVAPPATDACPAYEPGEQGAEAELVTVTDENTEEAPLEVTIEQEAGMASDQGLGEIATGSALYDGSSHTFRNLQVDTGGTENGLYIRYEFPSEEDHDLYVNYADGSEAAHVGGFNPAPVEFFDGTGAGGHSEEGAEQLDGLRTPDCAGYTVDFSNYLGAGGEYTVKLWLGEIQNDPAAPASARAALELMQGTLG